MSYFSTRGEDCVTASQAILNGIASDGGLYVPAMFPVIKPEKMIELTALPYAKRASLILREYLEDFSGREIDEALTKAYGLQFDDPRVAPVRRIDDDTHLLELFHGPTLAFKDMALQLLPYLITLSAEKNKESREISILVATSGDTGKAALEGFRNVRGTSCTVFYPMEGVSDVQRLQMTTTTGNNTHVIAVAGNFDDAQTGVKQLFSSESFRAEMNKRGKVLSSANSINFGRLVPQIVYYFSAYADLVASHVIMSGEPVNFVVPTGNFGDILAGYYARSMGLPVGKLICASNRNNVLTDFFASGTYSTHRMFFKTMSPSMDILVSSNLERLLYEAADRDGSLIATWMDQLKVSGSYSIGDQRLEWLQSVFAAGFADDRQTAMEISRRFEQDGCLLDPHTAVASSVLREYRARTQDMTPAVILATASPYKFARDVLTALHAGSSATLDAFSAAEQLEQISGVPIPSSVRNLRELPVRHNQRCQNDADNMAQAVLEALA